MERRKIIYYSDELNDEFSLAQITPQKINGNYRYIHSSLLKKFTHFFWYRIIFTPIAFLYTKFVFHHKIIGKDAFNKCKDSGYFVYGNHTQDIGDAFIPNMINIPQENYFIVHPNNVSMPIMGHITPSLGALPLPDDMAAYRNFLRAIETRINQKKSIVIYPEAHIWPFYTKIRPFSDASFSYPIKYGVPAFCFTNTYQKRKWSKKPNIVTYIDGPFYPNPALSAKEQRSYLRDQIYNCMCDRAKKSTVVKIEYIKREEKNG